MNINWHKKMIKFAKNIPKYYLIFDTKKNVESFMIKFTLFNFEI